MSIALKCKVEGCDRRIYSRETIMCNVHHKRFVRNGHTSTVREKHGLVNSTEYGIWENIMQRCENPNSTGYHRYGGRGISMCPEWRASFNRFYNDMGRRPSKKHTIDRIDNNLCYSKNNCRWATYHEQSFNKRMPSNNKSGYQGVSYDTSRQKWTAYLKHHGMTVFNKRYGTKDEAIHARKEAEIKYWGQLKTPSKEALKD